ncbi:MAG: helix-turn-helix transcriptional regulator, partial [Pseudomonadota bacterium]
MKRDLPSPSELRAMFGSNLRKLSKDYPSISELARQLGINRTQFNRYLSGESFPRPDVLARVCAFFDVDARVLLESVDEISSGEDPVANSYLRDYVGAGAANVPNALFPSGFYRFSRRSFMRDDRFMIGMVHVSRSGQSTFLRGYESAEVMGAQGGRVDGPSREYRGVVMQQEDGIVFMAARRNSMTSSF